MEWAEVALRLANYAIFSAAGGRLLFELLSVGPAAAAVTDGDWRFREAAFAAAGIIIALVSLVMLTMQMLSLPVGDIGGDAVQMVVSLLPAAKALVVRTPLLLLILLFCIVSGRHDRLSIWLRCSLWLGASATLAWSGHAAASEDAAGTVHRLADIAHIWTATLWIGGMTSLLAWADRSAIGSARQQLQRRLNAFSWIGVGIVAVISLSGMINLFLIRDIPDWQWISGTLYGRLLLGKLGIFVCMLMFAWHNRVRLTPAILGIENGDLPVARLRRSVAFELALGFAILGLVAWFGTLDPAGI